MDLAIEVLAFDPGVPVTRAFTPPASWYVGEAFHDLERTAVFRDTWQVACRADQIADNGSYVAGRCAGLPWVVVRGQDGVLRAFANTCRHKATEVCSGSGTASHLTCPYHGWTYRLDGSLRTAPRMGGIEVIERANMALPPLAVAAVGPLVLIHPDPGATEALPEALVRTLGDTGWGSLRWAGQQVYDLACNWKVFCDNYLDGGYHIPHMHPTLADQLDLATYRTELFDDYSVQTCDPAPAIDRTEGGALYVWRYPNLMINRYGPCLDTNIVLPVAPDRCRVWFDFWFDPKLDPEWIEASMASAEVTQREDMDISERVQIGMASGTWRRGPYAPRVEAAIHHFHRLLAADLRGALIEA